MALSPYQITARSVEIAKGLTALAPEEAVFADANLQLTRRTGVAARVAAVLRGQQKVTVDLLRHVASGNGVSWSELDNVVLPGLEELGWGEVKRNGRQLQGFVERVPPVDDVLRTLGKDWESNVPTVHDEGSVHGLDMLSQRPAARNYFASELKLDGPVASDVIDYGLAGTYFAERGGTLWSPLFWHGKPEDVFSFLERSDEGTFRTLRSLTGHLRERPGLPISALQGKNDVLEPAVVAGFFPTVGVKTQQGEFSYYFPPHAAFAGETTGDLFEKARSIVGAIRHGQFNADITKIRYPVSLLRRLREGSMAPHSHAIYQYAPLLTNGIATIEPVGSGSDARFKVLPIDTSENKQAFELAEMMLRGGEKVMGDLSDPEIRLAFGQGMMVGSAKERVARKRSGVAATDELAQLVQTVRRRKY